MTNTDTHSKIDNLLLEEEKIYQKVLKPRRSRRGECQDSTFFMWDITMVSRVRYQNLFLSKEIGFNTINVLIGDEIGSSISKSTGN